MELILEIAREMANSSGLWGMVGVLVGGAVTHWFQKSRDRDSDIKTTYASLHGLRRSLKQLYVSRFEAFIFSDAHEAKWRNSNFTSTVDFNEATRWMHRSEDLVFEISKAEERLARDCGLIFAVFKCKADMSEKVKALLNHEVPAILTRPETGWTNQQIDEWKNTAVGQLKTRTDAIFGTPYYLEPIEPRPQRKSSKIKQAPAFFCVRFRTSH